MSVLLINSNSLKIPLADRSVHCIVTSPPYYALRDYGTAKWLGGDPACDHKQRSARGDAGRISTDNRLGINPAPVDTDVQYKDKCRKCGALRVDDQIGLEQSPEAYIAKMVEVFRECWRVLRDDGTLWLNIGDSYAGAGGAGGDYAEGGLREGQPRYEGTGARSRRNDRGGFANLKAKDLIGIPWQLAFALRADGWYLRQDIIWNKPNPMPESVTDRCTKSHEYLFLLAKSARYYYDADAIREAPAESSIERLKYGFTGKKGLEEKHGSRWATAAIDGGKETFEFNAAGRNRRSVWTISKNPYAGAHFATFPPAIVEPCIKAGTSERGACPKCGAPWVRVTHTEYLSKIILTSQEDGRLEKGRNRNVKRMGDGKSVETLDWLPSCECDAGVPVPCVVFDPFAGSGTTLQVARALGRHGVGLDLSLKYLQECARPRLQLDALDAWINGIPARGDQLADLPLFGGLL